MSQNHIVTDIIKIAKQLGNIRETKCSQVLYKVAQEMGAVSTFDAPSSGKDIENIYENKESEQLTSEGISFSSAVADACRDIGVLVGFDIDNFLPEDAYNHAALIGIKEKAELILSNIAKMQSSISR